MRKYLKLLILWFFTIIASVSCKRFVISDDGDIGVEDPVPTTLLSPTDGDNDSIRLVAKIVGVKDGDTVEALYNEELLLTVRLAHIDAPEKRRSQPFGKASKQALSDLCFGQTVELVSEGQGERDGYGRLIAVIINAKKVNVNRQMLHLGMAWHFKKYSLSPVYSELEKIARQNKAGLWRDADAIPPWKWRKR